ncbi:uncharacterized protein LOC119663835 [Teleopsis dalmanni]|uniref:uncharacterized protein LOC119663835 n=1 Tax=Teleopsis dalmanni TaxID=139649 RepID=UPI0018CF14A8|nr:uncharacterized protein LOC119663835 [Teleopsis dalmanni]
MGPYPRTEEGNTPMRAAAAMNVTKYLERDIFQMFGVPEHIHSDNGKQFISEIFKNLLTKYGVNHVRTAFYSPEANAAERVNRSVLQMIRAYIGENHKNWDQHFQQQSTRYEHHDAETIHNDQLNNIRLASQSSPSQTIYNTHNDSDSSDSNDNDDEDDDESNYEDDDH